jgi:hypothetical protein
MSMLRKLIMQALPVIVTLGVLKVGRNIAGIREVRNFVL